MAWHRFLTLGMCTAAIAVGCTVSSGDDDDIEDDLGSGGDGASAGTGGSSTGGTGGTGGSAGSGGTTGGTGGATTGGAGGSGGVTYVCEPDDPSLSECDACVQSKCCDELIACAEDSTCISPDGESGEFACILECMDNIALDAGAVTTDDLLACGNACAESGDQVITETTQDLLFCINDEAPDAGGIKNCSAECLGLF